MTDKVIKVLLVDDHTVVRNGIQLMLGTASNIEVAGEAENAEDALKLVENESFNVALVDINMPGTGGLDLIKLLRAKKPQLRIVVLSMYSEDVYAMRALKLGAAGYLTKNCSASTVVSAVEKVAAGGKFFSPAVMDKLADIVGGNSPASHEALSDREMEVLKLIAQGDSLVTIADKLYLSPSTVTTYRTRILEKLQLKSNAELARYALVNGLLN